MEKISKKVHFHLSLIAEDSKKERNKWRMKTFRSSHSFLSFLRAFCNVPFFVVLKEKA